MSTERATNLIDNLSQSVQRVKLCNAIKFQQKKNIRFSDDFSIICRHQYSVFQMHDEVTSLLCFTVLII